MNKDTQLCFYQTFCTVLLLQNNLLLNKKTLINYIYNCKEQKIFKKLLKDVEVEQADTFISELINKKYLIKQKDYKNILQINKKILFFELKQNYYLREMIKFVCEYNKYEANLVLQATSKMYNQEEKDIKALVKSWR